MLRRLRISWQCYRRVAKAGEEQIGDVKALKASGVGGDDVQDPAGADQALGNGWWRLGLNVGSKWSRSYG